MEAECLASMPTAIRPTGFVVLVCLGFAMTLCDDDRSAVLREVHDLAMSMDELQRVGRGFR